MAVRTPDYNIKGGGRTSAGASQSIISEEPAGAKNGSNVTFTLSFPPSPCAGQSPAFALLLYLNGIRQSPYANGVGDYSLNGNIITYTQPPISTDQHEAFYFIGASAGNIPGTARFFNSASDVLDWGASSLYKILGDLSIGFWLKLPSTAAGCIIGRGYNDNTEGGSYFINVAGSTGAWSIRYGHDYAGTGNAELHTFATALPNAQWRYVGLSRDNTAKTVVCYVRVGAAMTTIGTFAYTNVPADSDGRSKLQVGNFPGGSGGSFGTAPLVGSVQEHYLSHRSGPWSSDEHLAASNGNPPTSGLVLSCAMGNTPEVDTSGNGGVGAVTGTTLVQGHS